MFVPATLRKGWSMTTKKQIDANRVNARKSTGPRSQSGNAPSRGSKKQQGTSAQLVANTDELDWATIEKRLSKVVDGQRMQELRRNWRHLKIQKVMESPEKWEEMEEELAALPPRANLQRMRSTSSRFSRFQKPWARTKIYPQKIKSLEPSRSIIFFRQKRDGHRPFHVWQLES
jgi:hypothetical protein